MRIVIVIHSVCGNTCLLGKTFADSFSQLGHTALLRRVADTNWIEKPDTPEPARAILRDMRALPEAVPEDLLEADIIILGSPVYFGNVSGNMKSFMDLTGGFWFQGKLAGKKFAAFVSAGNADGGGDLALQALRTYGAYMGMLCIPMPVTILPGEHTNALGLIQYSNGKYATVLDEKTSRLVRNWAVFMT